jgi:hypothetical protein
MKKNLSRCPDCGAATRFKQGPVGLGGVMACSNPACLWCEVE